MNISLVINQVNTDFYLQVQPFEINFFFLNRKIVCHTRDLEDEKYFQFLSHRKVSFFPFTIQSEGEIYIYIAERMHNGW